MLLKRFFKGLLVTLLVVFVLLNIIAAFHAYRFTHFSNSQSKALNETNALSFSDKMKVILTGVEMPRPVNKVFPSQPYKTIHLKSNVMLEAWTVQADSAKGTVILFHGYRADKSQMLDKSDEFLKMGYNTMVVDFMGSGGSEGNTTTIGYDEAQEVKTCFDYVAGTGEKRIFLDGISMGATAVLKAMDDYHLPVSGIIIECPFGTMFKTVCARFRLMGVPWFPMSHFLMVWGGIENGFWPYAHNPTNYAKSVQCPALLLYGEQDNRVSRMETDAIYANLKGKKQLITYPLAGHEDYLHKYHEKWVNDVRSFVSNN